jgi:hypothetical protein
VPEPVVDCVEDPVAFRVVVEYRKVCAASGVIAVRLALPALTMSTMNELAAVAVTVAVAVPRITPGFQADE